ncbi:hypothetical protein SDC9_56967 [bioreactor metagenome]|uniref:Uncharacterized protein n=1 Tax=bioreactor metagenome TaxID=1076179 RepID=A0A644X917_9ZZZZ
MMIKDKQTSIVVLGNDAAVELGDREFVCRTKGTIKGYSLTIDFSEIKEYTKKSEKVKQQMSNTPIKEKFVNSEDILKVLGL